MKYSDQQLIDSFIKTIKIKSSNTKELFTIGFVGIVGSGKSFVAQKISEKLNLYIASNDKIRRFLNSLGFEGDHPLQRVVRKTSLAVTKYLFENNMSHIIDADLIEFYKNAEKIADEFQSNLYIIEIKCPEKIILDRLEKRSKNLENNLSRAGKEKYFERKELHNLLSKSKPEIFFRIDTSKNVDSQIDELILKFKKEKII